MAVSVTFLLDGLAIGGAELHTLKLARHLSQAGFWPSLVVYSGVRSSAINDEELPARTKILGRRSMNADPAGWVLAGQAIASYEPGLVIAVNQAAFSAAAIAKILRRYRAPLVCLFHTFLMASARDRLRLPVFRALLRAADELVFVGGNQREHWRERRLWQGKDRLIRNGIDVEAFAPAPPETRRRERAALGFGNDDFVVSQVAQFRPEKNQAQLVEAAAALRARGVPVKLLFVGEGPLRDAVEKQAAALGLGGEARFVGEQRDVRPFFGASDVSVLCSTTETMPLAALEALACSVPVVLPDIGGASEIVQPGRNGYLYPVGEVGALAERLFSLAHEPVRHALRAEARRSVADEFDERRMFREYEALVRSY